MKIGIILETKEQEKARNPFRFSTTTKTQGHDKERFLQAHC
jgi:hypothetical protein